MTFILKYNPNHDPETGKFTTGTSKVTTAADVNAFFNPGTESMNGFLIGENSTGLSEEEMRQQTALIKFLLAGTSAMYLSTVSFKSLDADTLAQCQMYWNADEASKEYGGTLYVDTTKSKAIADGWNADQTDIAMGKKPWVTASYGARSDMQKNILRHEIAHEIMGEHIIRSTPMSEWNDPNSPMRGDQQWKDVIHEAAQSGWQPPSEYSKQNYAEMFAECYVVKEIKGTTGDEGVDEYIQDVVKYG